MIHPRSRSLTPPADAVSVETHRPISDEVLSIILIAALIVAHGAMFYALVRQWVVEDDLAHGVFVPLVAGWAAWEKRRSVAEAAVQPSYWGLVLLLWGCVQGIVADLSAELYLSRTAFLISLTGLLAFVRGWTTVRILSFPLALLLFMFPIPGVLYREVTFPLQLLASRLAESSLEMIGYTVIREGNLLELAGQRLSVVEACSGVRSLLTLGFFAVSYAWFVDPRPWVRWVMLGLALPVAVVTNAGRIVVTAIVGEYDQDLAYGAFHAISGWGILVASALLLIAIHALIHRLLLGRRSAAGVETS